mmetsp:Transcript_69602/g.193674  ORF Transcript_69602/g.193674 Transcript_69602/m.193674 type:complete len:400 (-) Transcript_69602:109-1308(-)
MGAAAILICFRVAVALSAITTYPVEYSNGSGNCSTASRTLLQTQMPLTRLGFIHTHGFGSHSVHQQPSAGAASAASTFQWPILFLHVPKTGGNFGNTLVHAACECVRQNESFKVDADAPQCCRDTGRFARVDRCHRPLSRDAIDLLPEPQLSHVGTMIREPRNRLLSGFYHNRHDCFLVRLRLAPDCRAEGRTRDENCSSLQETATPDRMDDYVSCAGQCATRLLTGSLCSTQGHSSGKQTELTGPEEVLDEAAPHAVVALERLDKLGFVGLTDEYDLSVCLWHARFGGPCLATEFDNLRPGSHSSNHTGYEEAETAFSPKSLRLISAEVALWERAKKRFWTEVKEYNVSRSRCAQICPDPPEIFSAPISLVGTVGKSDFDPAFEYNWPGRHFLPRDVD